MAVDLAAWVRRRSAGVSRYLFGIAGPPGSGKSTIAATLGAELGAPVVPMDGFHLSNASLSARGQLDIKGAPETFAASGFVELVRRLRDPTEVVECPTFDRTVDEPIDRQVRVSAKDVVVIVEGNYLLLDEAPWSALSDLFDAIAYLEVPEALRLERLIARHIEHGRSPTAAEIFVRRSDAVNAVRVEASRPRADLVVPAER